MVLDVHLVYTASKGMDQGEMEQSKERSGSLPYTSVY